MTNEFVDHLQLLPLPSVDGVRQPDGDHRPGGLGLRTLADRLGAAGWTARLEDFGFEKPVGEVRIAEAYARAIGDAVLSAWDRNRFPIVLSRVNACAVGVIDGFGPGTGVLWVSPRGDYRKAGRLRRPNVDRMTLSLVTGRQERDRLAAEPKQTSPSHVIVLGGEGIDGGEARALAEDGIQTLGPSAIEELGAAVDAIAADRWYVHIDASSFSGATAPAADEPGAGDFEPDALAEAIESALQGRAIVSVALTRYDLNRDRDGRTAETFVGLLDRLLSAAGGEPNPAAREAATTG